MVINIAVHKTLIIYSLVNKLFIATILSIQCFNIHTSMYGKKNNFMKIKKDKNIFSFITDFLLYRVQSL